MALRPVPQGDAQLELFSAIFTDIATRDARDTMEAPFLSISKNPRFEPIMFRKGELEMVVTGGKPYGIANIWDWDLIIWLMSQIRQALDRGEQPSRRIRFHRHAFLKASRRGDGGAQFKRLDETIQRLSNTNVFTTIRPAPGKRTVKFSWLEYADVERDDKGRITHAIVVLPEWLYAAACDSKQILSLDRDYFLLTGGLERWLYRLIRKGAGRNPNGWRWKLRTLHESSGTQRAYKYFARDVRKIAESGFLLSYSLALEEDSGEQFLRATRFGAATTKAQLPELTSSCGDPSTPSISYLRLSTATYEAAKNLAPGYDIYALEADWKAATQRNGIEVREPDKAFLSWCRRVNERKPLAS